MDVRKVELVEPEFVRRRRVRLAADDAELLLLRIVADDRARKALPRLLAVGRLHLLLLHKDHPPILHHRLGVALLLRKAVPIVGVGVQREETVVVRIRAKILDALAALLLLLLQVVEIPRLGPLQAEDLARPLDPGHLHLVRPSGRQLLQRRVIATRLPFVRILLRRHVVHLARCVVVLLPVFRVLQRLARLAAGHAAVRGALDRGAEKVSLDPLLPVVAVHVGEPHTHLGRLHASDHAGPEAVCLLILEHIDKHPLLHGPQRLLNDGKRINLLVPPQERLLRLPGSLALRKLHVR